MPKARNRAGSYRHLVTLFRPDNRNADGKGDFNGAYIPAYQDWFAVDPLGGKSYWLAQQVREDQPVNFTCRANDEITTQWRLGWNGKIYDIESINSPEEANRVTSIIAIERGIMPDDDGNVSTESTS
jgi:SPP1 family predicted phage head-tail adaptor